MTTTPPSRDTSIHGAHAGSGRAWLLVNPRAGGGRAADRVRAVREAFDTVFADAHGSAGGSAQAVHVEETRERGDERRIAMSAAAAGASALLVLGGDGTVHHAVRGLLAADSTMPLAVLASGTGNDLAKSIDAPHGDYRAMAALLRAGHTRRIDVGFADGVPFVNCAGFGFDVAVLERLLGAGGSTASPLTYAKAALTSITGYGGFDAEAAGEGIVTGRRRRLLLVFANGPHFGGAFRIAPAARLDDGLLDAVDIGAMGTMSRIGLFARALRGAHSRAAGVHMARGRDFTVRFDSPPSFEVDGELYRAQRDEVQVGVRPGALRIVCAQGG